MAKLVNERGKISPLCASQPRIVPVNAWTLTPKQVTCTHCRRLLKVLA